MRRRQFASGLAGALWAPALLAAPATAEVGIADYRFDPASLTVPAGTTVRWTNREKRTTHSVLFAGDAPLESDRLFPGDTWERRFDTPGTYRYTCGPHPEMKGEIVVLP